MENGIFLMRTECLYTRFPGFLYVTFHYKYYNYNTIRLAHHYLPTEHWQTGIAVKTTYIYTYMYHAVDDDV